MFPNRVYRTTTRAGLSSVEVVTPGTSQRCTVAPLLRKQNATALARQLQDAYNAGVADTRMAILPTLQTLRETLDLAACMDQYNPRPGDTLAKGRSQGFGHATALLDRVIEGIA